MWANQMYRGITGYNQPPQPAASPGPNKGQRRPGVQGGPPTPQQNPQSQTYPDRGSPHQVPRPRSPPPNPVVNNNLADLDPERIPASQKKEGADWFALFNPRVPRLLDVDLVHTLEHNSVVCCVRFSQDGKYVATGCNRSAQIFDVKTGTKVSHLQDETVDRDGDLYIRSVCFSPDGRYLATGAEDKQIRVSLMSLSTRDIALSPSGKTWTYNFSFCRLVGVGYSEPRDQAHVSWT